MQTEGKKDDEMTLGPSPNKKDFRVLILVPQHLQYLAQSYCEWANSSQTPVSYFVLNQPLPLEVSFSHVIKLILISTPTQTSSSSEQKFIAEQEEALSPLCAKLTLMHQKAKNTWRLWPVDTHYNPVILPPTLQELTTLYHLNRMKALSLLLGGVTLTVALKEGQQLAPSMNEAESPKLFSAPHFAELEKSSRSQKRSFSNYQRKVYHFPWVELHKRIKEIERFGRLSYLPLLIGLLLSSIALLLLTTYLNQQINSTALVSLFVLGQLSLGAGMIGFLWSYFEHRGLKQRVFLFWIDEELGEPLQE